MGLEREPRHGARLPWTARGHQPARGKVVVIDPRRTETAAGVDEHLFIKPGTDAFLVLAMAHTLFAEGLVELGDLEGHVTGLDDIERIVRPFTPEAVASRTGISPGRHPQASHASSRMRPPASIYDRVGVHQHTFGTLTSWASDVVNVITGNLDRAGGRMFPIGGARAARSRGAAGTRLVDGTVLEPGEGLPGGVRAVAGCHPRR